MTALPVLIIAIVLGLAILATAARRPNPRPPFWRRATVE